MFILRDNSLTVSLSLRAFIVVHDLVSLLPRRQFIHHAPKVGCERDTAAVRLRVDSPRVGVDWREEDVCVLGVVVGVAFPDVRVVSIL